MATLLPHMVFEVGDRVVVTCVRAGLRAKVGDTATVINVTQGWGGCDIKVKWDDVAGCEGFVYADQFKHLGGPW